MLGFEHQNPNSKQALEAVKILKILRSDKAPMIKKRQAMRNAFGDYRQKMKAEERKSIAKMKKVCFTPANDIKGENSCFIKKSMSKQDKNNTATRDNEERNVNQDVASQSSSIEINELQSNSDFKFKPSDNSFVFNFGASQEQNDAICGCGSDIVDNTSGSIHDKQQSQTDVNTEIDTKTNSNEFILTENTDNCFKFNFQLPDS